MRRLARTEAREHDCVEVAQIPSANVEGSAVTAIVATARTQVERVFPRGAIILSILSFAYFGMGIIRNRVFANTYGADVELDAYNAAFRIPEVALDVLVAAGLAAPFVPIYSRLRHDDSSDRSANEFGQTILTGAVGLMTVASIVIFLVAPSLPDLVVGGFDPATKDLYVQLLRINCVAQVLFAASFALGECASPMAGSPSTPFAPILYSAGSSWARCCSERGTAWSRPHGARSPAPPPTSRIRADRHPANDLPDPAPLRRSTPPRSRSSSA